MAELPSVRIAAEAPPEARTAVVLVDDSLAHGARAAALGFADTVRRAAAAAEFKGKAAGLLDVLAPQSGAFDRLIVVGLGKVAELTPEAWVKLGGATMGALKKGEQAAVFLDLPGGQEMPAGAAADFGLGVRLRGYVFDKYKRSREENGNGRKGPAAVTLVTAAADAAERWQVAEAVSEGVVAARDLVNEPANYLGPVEFAARAAELATLGVEVEVLGEPEMSRLKMGALLGVAQGSARPPRLVVMRWKGADTQPLAFVGKGVVFDTGGISIKPAAGMEDMKGDMAGAAAVTGLMRTLALRKAKVDAVGVIGLVENMPDGNAQRPGDIVTSMSGQTIEVINTDAEGRLVLADLLTYVQERFKPRFVIDLATLTGAIMVALGSHHAGMYSNDDALAAALTAAGEATGERVWRMPLGPDYDKLIDSTFADMKNVGGRYAGSITAAQFIKRFVKDTAWVHLDIAGTGMGSPQTETSKSWASGYGVRLLDRLVRDKYED